MAASPRSPSRAEIPNIPPIVLTSTIAVNDGVDHTRKHALTTRAVPAYRQNGHGLDSSSIRHSARNNVQPARKLMTHSG